MRNRNSLKMNIERLSGPAVRLHLSADDWMLYNADTPEEDQDRDYAAMDLNRAVEEAVAATPQIKMVRVPQAFADHSKWGATDTVVREYFYDLLEEIYHGNSQRAMA